MKIREIRDKYPQYNDMSDVELADAFHDKFYSDIPKEDYYKKLGVSTHQDQDFQKNQSNMFQPRMMNPSNTGGAPAQNLLAGLLQNVKSNGATIVNNTPGVPEAAKAAYENAPIDPYKITGTTKQSFNTPEGAMQALGEHGPDIAGIGQLAKILATKGFGLAKSGVQGIKNIYKTAKESPELINVSKPDKIPKPGEIPELQEISSTAEPAASQLLTKLGGGAKNLEENSKNLSAHIMNAHDMRESQAQPFINHPLQQAGDERVFEKVDPLVSTKIDQSKEAINKVKDLKVGDLYKKFEQKQSFQNTHNLQSELGVLLGDLEKRPDKTIDDANTIKNIKSARDYLKNGIMDFLKKRDLRSNETLAPMYQKGIDLYRENVVPYLSSDKLRNIVRGGEDTTKDIHSIFDTPFDIKNRKTGETKIGPINKIMQDLPEDAKDKILFSKIGGLNPGNDAIGLIKSLKNAENNGYSKYFNQHTKDAILDIAQKSNEDVTNKLSQALKYKAALKNQTLEHKSAQLAQDLAYKNSLNEAKKVNQANIQKQKDAQRKINTLHGYLKSIAAGAAGATLVGGASVAHKLRQGIE